MAEILLSNEESPIYPGLPVRDDIEIYEDTTDNCYKVRDKATGELLTCIPRQTEL